MIGEEIKERASVERSAAWSGRLAVLLVFLAREGY